MDLDRLAIKVQGFLADQLGPFSQILPGLLFAGVAQISQAMLAEIFRKTLEGLLITPGRAQTVNPPIVLVIIPAGPQSNLFGDCMFSLGLR